MLEICDRSPISVYDLGARLHVTSVVETTGSHNIKHLIVENMTFTAEHAIYHGKNKVYINNTRLDYNDNKHLLVYTHLHIGRSFWRLHFFWFGLLLGGGSVSVSRILQNTRRHNKMANGTGKTDGFRYVLVY